MPKLRRLSGDEVISILERFGFSLVSHRGTHAKLRRITATGARETLTIPRHKELDTGTLHAIYRQAGRYIPQEQLYPFFYSD